MIYAYRGVDLVVGVMGVLGAGGAFSVVGGSGMGFVLVFGLILWLMCFWVTSSLSFFLLVFRIWRGLEVELWGGAREFGCSAWNGKR